MTGKREAEELLLIEEADAWFEYGEAIRGQTEARYLEIEPWAWARLQQRLRAIKAQARQTEPPRRGVARVGALQTLDRRHDPRPERTPQAFAEAGVARGDGEGTTARAERPCADVR